MVVGALVFAPAYLLAANAFRLIEDDEKETVLNFAGRLLPKRTAPALNEF